MQNIETTILRIEGVTYLGLAETLLCGQAFRWRETAPGRFHGVVQGQTVEIWMDDDLLCIACARPDDAFWRDYFDLGADYETIRARLARHPELNKAILHAPGIRVLRQDSWETLLSFIISQNNHIGRISGIIERLCRLFGDPLESGSHAFPAPDRIAAHDIGALAPLQAGYRDRYILDAARMVASGDLNLKTVAALPTCEARAELMRIKGVGRKVADCTLLFGFYRTEVCPMDVWMKRAMARLFPNGWPDDILPVAGIAQQYLFHYARTCPGALDAPANTEGEAAYALPNT